LGVVLLAGSSSGTTGVEAVPAGYPYKADVQTIARIQDRSHFPLGQVYNAYNSNPPTSGPHAAQFANWGISDLAIPKEQAVHNMEHGGVVVWYNCNAQPILSGDACTELRNQLSAVVSTAIAGGAHVLMTPYSDMDHHIALTAWGFLATFDTFDQAHVQAFIDAFQCNFDPEHFCG
jgi:hypothetical protein